jgi:tetratricopeptide (TPR) repeat protein
MKRVLASSVLAAFLSSGVVLAQTKPASNRPKSSAPRDSGFEALVAEANAAREAEHTSDAIRLYQAVVKAKPSYTEGWWYLGTLLYDTDQYPEARVAFRHVTGLKPEMAVAWAMLGLCEFEVKAYDSALVHLQRADRLNIPNQESFYEVSKYHLALLYIRAGRFEQAIKIIGDFAREGKDSPQFIEAMGLAGLRKPLLPSELPPLEREMVLDVGRALCHASARRAVQAETDRAELIRKYPKAPQIHFLAGTMALGSDPDEAIREWKAELLISPAHPQALASIAGEYLKRHDYQAALPYAEKAVESSPTSYAAHAILGQLLAEGELDIARGITELETAVRLAPLQPQVHYALASAYTKAGRKEEAAKERSEFLKLRGQSAVSKPT